MFKIALVGYPNVGKSVLFNALTGRYAVVSNYPGTTVDVSWGEASFGRITVQVVDTPGTHSLLPGSEEEAVTRRLLWTERFELVLHVVDAKSLERMLPLTLALDEAGFRLILVVNMYDEAKCLGCAVDIDKLASCLGFPCVATVGPSRWGVDTLQLLIARELSGALSGFDAGCSDLVSRKIGSRWVSQRKGRLQTRYPRPIEAYLRQARQMIRTSYPFSVDTIALLALQEDEEILEWLQPPDRATLTELVRKQQRHSSASLALAIASARRIAVDNILRQVRFTFSQPRVRKRAILDSITLSPVTGVPLLVLVMYLFLYKFIGVFGAGVLVDFLDQDIFLNLFNPFVNFWVDKFVGNPLVRELIAHEYGVVTLGLRYAVAIVLPIVVTFFASFAVLEDSGYLPRLAFLVDRICKSVGLSGRAIVPLTLGLGCGTMATLVTRTLETRRERIIATLILALAIPCSAQLGVILGLLTGRPRALTVWLVSVGSVALIVSWLTARLLPGDPPHFFLELPPLRWPDLRNVVAKTRTRVSWYFMEILPIFILASFLIWIGRVTGVLDGLLTGLVSIMHALGLPPETGQVFLYGFFRRDYGAAGLYDLQHQLTSRQITVASVTLTLFVPCIAQMVMMFKERGIWVALAIVSFVFFLAFGVGILLNTILCFTGIL